MALVPSGGSGYIVPSSGGNMGGFWNSLNNRLVNKAIEYGRQPGIGGQIYDAIMNYGKNGLPNSGGSQKTLPTTKNGGLLTYPQPSVYPQINWARNNSKVRVYRIKQLGGGTTPSVAWGPGLYADFVGGGLADPFFLQ